MNATVNIKTKIKETKESLKVFVNLISSGKHNENLPVLIEKVKELNAKLDTLTK